MDQQNPHKYSHRIICKIVDSFHGGKKCTAQEYDRVGRVFVKMGGSWQGILDGSVEDFQKLKKVIKVAVKHGYLGKGTKEGGPDSQSDGPEESE